MIVTKVKMHPKLNKAAARSGYSAVAASVPQVRDSQDRIRERAFELFEKRGGVHGYDTQDWFHAERQIQATQ
jgi:hypothetical protein